MEYCIAESLECKCKDKLNLKAMKEELQKDIQEIIETEVIVEGNDVNITEWLLPIC
jgi:hypothetical protein